MYFCTTKIFTLNILYKTCLMIKNVSSFYKNITAGFGTVLYNISMGHQILKLSVSSYDEKSSFKLAAVSNKVALIF